MTDENNYEDVNETSEQEETTTEEPTPMEQFFKHQRKALEETGKALDALLPEKFKQHSGEAGREFGKGFRVLIDAAIDELKKVSEKEDVPQNEEEDNDDENPPSSTGKTKVKVKVD